MGKYKNDNYCQIYNKAIEKLNEYKIPYSARWLYVHLNFLEHRFTGEKEDFFFRSISDLQKDTQMGRRQVSEGLKMLAELKLIQKWQMHWTDKKTGNKSQKHVTAIRVL